jgi:hypothetical protein
MSSTIWSSLKPVVLLCVMVASASSAACGHSSPVAATSTLQLTGGAYFVRLNASSSSCSPTAPAVGVQFAFPLPLMQLGADATMAFRNDVDAFDLAGTMIGDRLSFSMHARQSSPVQTATASGIGTAVVQGEFISGTFAGDFVLSPFARTPFRCHAADHTLLMTRLSK